MQRVAAKAIVRTYLDTCTTEYPELSKRDLELVEYALRFCPIKNVIARIDASGRRELLKQLNEELI